MHKYYKTEYGWQSIKLKCVGLENSLRETFDLINTDDWFFVTIYILTSPKLCTDHIIKDMIRHWNKATWCLIN